MKLHYTKHYDALVKRLIFGSNPFRANLYFNDTGHAAIGFNFDLRDTFTLRRVLEVLGFDVHGKHLGAEALVAERYYMGLLRSAFAPSNGSDLKSLKVVVQNILSARLSDPRYRAYPHFQRTSEFKLSNEHKGLAVVNAVIEQHERTVDNWLTAFGFDILKANSHLLSRNTKERAVLVSLAAQHVIGTNTDGSPLGLPLAHALMDNDRAQCWYQIRYGVQDQDSPSKQIIKRRYFESEIFDIYDEGITSDTISREYCKKMYAMYNACKDVILQFERRFNHLIPEANAQYRLSGRYAIKTIEQSFALAYNHIRNRPYAAAPINNFVQAYTEYVEEGIEGLVEFWAQTDDLDYEIALAS
ncbi:MAG: hypothetical protein PVJ39_18005 [Gammaproteobacteria bacterium]|jgi:hypothetical protein